MDTDPLFFTFCYKCELFYCKFAERVFMKTRINSNF